MPARNEEFRTQSTVASKQPARDLIAEQTALFLKNKGRIDVIPGFGEKTRADLTIQGAKNRAFA